jgi:RHS repeat-associated protein
VTGTTSTNAYQLTSRETDGTGLLYYRARYYSPVLQRFILEDPIGFNAVDPNLYAYVFNGPTNYSDPTEEVFPLAVGLGAVLGGIGGGYSAYHAATKYLPPILPSCIRSVPSLIVNNGVIKRESR